MTFYLCIGDWPYPPVPNIGLGQDRKQSPLFLSFSRRREHVSRRQRSCAIFSVMLRALIAYMQMHLFSRATLCTYEFSQSLVARNDTGSSRRTSFRTSAKGFTRSAGLLAPVVELVFALGTHTVDISTNTAICSHPAFGQRSHLHRTVRCTKGAHSTGRYLRPAI